MYMLYIVYTAQSGFHLIFMLLCGALENLHDEIPSGLGPVLLLTWQPRPCMPGFQHAA